MSPVSYNSSVRARVEEALDHDLKKIAASRRVKVAVIIREALADYVAKHKPLSPARKRRR